jgi:hypothetical protein
MTPGMAGALAVYIGSAIYTPAIPGVMEHFSCSRVAATAGLTPTSSVGGPGRFPRNRRAKGIPSRRLRLQPRLPYRRWYCGLLVGLQTLAVYIGSAIYTPAIPGVMEHFSGSFSSKSTSQGYSVTSSSVATSPSVPDACPFSAGTADSSSVYRPSPCISDRQSTPRPFPASWSTSAALALPPQRGALARCRKR